MTEHLLHCSIEFKLHGGWDLSIDYMGTTNTRDDIQW